VSASEAEKLNMIYKAVDDESFDEEIKNFANQLALMPTRGLGLTKKAVNLGLFNSLEDQLDVEEKIQVEAGSTEDFAEGVAAFLQKRQPKFKGK
jgi:2-(1,2-epoxy-1,2-dihydrophenyl)acetyl-CoA isomerase